MTKRTIPQEPGAIANEIVEQCSFAKLMDDRRLIDHDPLVVVLQIITAEIEERDLDLDLEETKQLWLDIVGKIQNGDSNLEHNPFVACWKCDLAFLPVVDPNLMKMFFQFNKSGSPDDLVAIHTCSNCGGSLSYSETKTYEGDMHTPPPKFTDDAEIWTIRYLRHYEW